MLSNWTQEIMARYKYRIKGTELILKTCPNCNNTRYNIQISMTRCSYHCWVCNDGGSVTRFLLANDVPFDRDDIVPVKVITEEQDLISLPKSTPLWLDTSRFGTIAINYLVSRGMSTKLIESWHVRLATGEDKEFLGIDYTNHIIVPFYGLQGLEYFIAIRFFDGKGYKLPKSSKDVFTPLIRGSKSIVLVEGFFDGISSWNFTDLDILMLWGKFLLEKQIEMLLASKYETIYICLDGDAYKEAVKLGTMLFRMGANIKLVKLPVQDDPDSAREDLPYYIKNAETLTLTSASNIKTKRLKTTLM